MPPIQRTTTAGPCRANEHWEGLVEEIIMVVSPAAEIPVTAAEL